MLTAGLYLGVGAFLCGRGLKKLEDELLKARIRARIEQFIDDEKKGIVRNPELEEMFDQAFGNVWEVAQKDIHEQAKHADCVTVGNVTDVDFLKSCCNDGKDWETEPLGPINATSIGNVAFVALNAPEPYNKKSKKLLDILCRRIIETNFKKPHKRKRQSEKSKVTKKRKSRPVPLPDKEE